MLCAVFMFDVVISLLYFFFFLEASLGTDVGIAIFVFTLFY